MAQITIDIPEGADTAQREAAMRAARQAVEKVFGAAPEKSQPEPTRYANFYEAAVASGLIGGEMFDGPEDLSSNPDHFEGFGR